MTDKDKTKEQLITELTVLRHRVTQLETSEMAFLKLAGHLHERAKELACIYIIAQIIDDPDITLHKIFQQVVDVLPIGWQYPEIARARIVIGDKEFRPLGYIDTNWKLSSDIEAYGEKKGTVEVCYLEQKPEMNMEPFLSEEWLLLSIVAGRLGRLIERKQAD
jgi:two-component system NarL family sensor kinase